MRKVLGVALLLLLAENSCPISLPEADNNAEPYWKTRFAKGTPGAAGLAERAAEGRAGPRGPDAGSQPPPHAHTRTPAPQVPGAGGAGSPTARAQVPLHPQLPGSGRGAAFSSQVLRERGKKRRSQGGKAGDPPQRPRRQEAAPSPRHPRGSSSPRSGAPRHGGSGGGGDPGQEKAGKGRRRPWARPGSGAPPSVTAGAVGAATPAAAGRRGCCRHRSPLPSSRGRPGAPRSCSRRP
ncbi:serine/arginine repetitive matrix protein 3-like [Dipodomys merriami]|uniref:serine/arginine repetitive matrix protein 3-like n=1 Tax=Dipodomys merriami TaxID=94247 RepID=UPI003855AA00